MIFYLFFLWLQLFLKKSIDFGTMHLLNYSLKNSGKKLDKLLDIFIRIELTVFNCVSTKSFDVLSLAENQPGLVKNEQEGI